MMALCEFYSWTPAIVRGLRLADYVAAVDYVNESRRAANGDRPPAPRTMAGPPEMSSREEIREFFGGPGTSIRQSET